VGQDVAQTGGQFGPDIRLLGARGQLDKGRGHQAERQFDAIQLEAIVGIHGQGIRGHRGHGFTEHLPEGQFGLVQR